MQTIPVSAVFAMAELPSNENPPVLLASVLLAGAPNAKVDEAVLEVFAVVTGFEPAPPPKVNMFPELAAAGGAAASFLAPPNVKDAEVSAFLVSVFAMADPKSKDGGAFEAVVTTVDAKLNGDEVEVLDALASVVF